jgi:hypothetical protein
MRALRILAVLLVAASPALGAETWHGKISDSNCGATHKSVGEHGSMKTEADCTNACVKGGAKYVFVSDGKVYQIANQDAAGLAQNAGKDVTVSGTMSGETITVEKVAGGAAKKAKKS